MLGEEKGGEEGEERGRKEGRGRIEGEEGEGRREREGWGDAYVLGFLGTGLLF